MLTVDAVKAKLSDLEERYCSFMIEHFFLDARAQQEIGFPNTSILIAFK